MKLIHLHRLANKLYKWKVPIVPKLIYHIQYILYNSSVPYKCDIGEKTVFGYGGIALVLHERSTIGKGCVIGQNVTIGGKSKAYNVPIIGDHVYIGAGAKILGDLKIGDNVIVGANAVVTKDVPSNCIVAGIPAKVIKKDIDIDDFEEF